MPNCLAGCIDKYLCGGLNEAIDSTAYAPYVKLKIAGEEQQITVGNESCPAFGNAAVIKSMQCGFSDSAGVTLEIHDEQGGSFEYFMDKLNKCIASMTTDYTMELEFGWIGTGCGADSGKILKKNPPVHFMPIQVSASMTDGKIRFTLTGTSLLEGISEARAAKVYKGTLKSAIQQLFDDKEYPPQVPQVKFLRRTPDGKTDTWKFEAKFDGPDGPTPPNGWSSDGQNKIATAMAWLEPFRTDRSKGLRPSWEAESPKPTIVFWEDPYVRCGESKSCGPDSLGTFIVNGGQCSPVLSFSPTAKWNFDALHAAGGGTGGSLSTGGVENQGRENCDDIVTKGAGVLNSTPIPQAMMDTHGPNQAADEFKKSSAEHDHAQQIIQPISAELRIQGDPDFTGNTNLMGRSVSVVVINPFHIESYGGGACGDWLAAPGCNPVYSNRSWLVFGADHSLQEGQYVTTLKLFLAMPGVDVERNAPFGATGSGGWTPPTGCRT